MQLLRRIVRYGIRRLGLENVYEKYRHPGEKPSIEPVTKEQYLHWIAERNDDDRIVDIVIPVYKGLKQTQACIESVSMHPQRRPSEMVVIDDCSPEPELTSYLQRLAGDRRITLIKNETNRGFVQSVNMGMGMHPRRDVVLLNSDTVVANDWLDRLVMAAHSDWRIATVTPFSNNATICSYPRFCEENRLPEGYDVVRLDRLFRKFNKGKRVPIPTAIGFCTYIKRICLNHVGLFDADRFGKGYGEENDFCMRASHSGWYHVLAADTFVFHEGSVSFGDELQHKFADVMKTIEELHPSYLKLIDHHIRLDPACRYRKTVDLHRLSNTQKPVVLMISHHRGGGTERHIRELADFFHASLTVLVLRPEQNRFVSLSWENTGEQLKLYFSTANEIEALLEFLKEMGVVRIHFHHFVDLPRWLWYLPEKLHLPYDVTLHDYFAVCPRICLLNYRDKYCKEKGENACIYCAQDVGICIAEWREVFRRLLKNADRILSPSADSRDRILKYYPDIPVIAAYHPDSERIGPYPEPSFTRIDATGNLRIVVMGGLSRHKGADVLNAVAVAAARGKMPLEFHLIGHAYREFDETALKTNLFIYGRYDNKKQRELVRSIQPHIGWIPALWPETYSYVLSEMMELALPVVATNLGAFPERLSGRACSWIMDWDSTTADWIEFFLQVRKRFTMNDWDIDRSEKQQMQHIEKDFYAKHYLSFLTDRPIPAGEQRNLMGYLNQPEDPFDPDAYLKANPDVATAIASGVFVSATQHWREYGKAEGRRLCLENSMGEKGDDE